MDARETPAPKAAEDTVPQAVPGDICTLAMCNTIYAQEEVVWHILAWAACCYSETEKTHDIHLTSS